MPDISALEWQIAEGSTTAHVINPEQNWGNVPRRGEPGYRASGPRALCGRYPQRHNDFWFGLPADTPRREFLRAAGVSYRLCPDCDDALPTTDPTTEETTDV